MPTQSMRFYNLADECANDIEDAKKFLALCVEYVCGDEYFANENLSYSNKRALQKLAAQLTANG